MERLPACPVCGRTDQPWPIMEAGTGERFCGDCYHAVSRALPPRWPGHTVTLRQWRAAIKTARREHQAAHRTVTH